MKNGSEDRLIGIIDSKKKTKKRMQIDKEQYMIEYEDGSIRGYEITKENGLTTGTFYWRKIAWQDYKNSNKS